VRNLTGVPNPLGEYILLITHTKPTFHYLSLFMEAIESPGGL